MKRPKRATPRKSGTRTAALSQAYCVPPQEIGMSSEMVAASEMSEPA